MEDTKGRHVREMESSIAGIKLVEHLDLETFKMNPCSLAPSHNHKQCLYYHSEKDKRRDFVECGYGPILCEEMNNSGRCTKGLSCRNAHSKAEQAYHPTKYRFKFCSYFPGAISECLYGKFCSYAHSEQEIKCELIHNYSLDVDFYLYLYKTKFCPFTKPHDRGSCVYAHNWQDYRRDPSCYIYAPVECNSWQSSRTGDPYDQMCPNGDNCGSCHGNHV